MKIVFILTLWNSGSTFLLNSLEKIDNSVGISEPRSLRKKILQYILGDKTCFDDIVKQLESYRVETTLTQKFVFVKEPTLCLIADKLQKIFPSDCFIHLKRNLKDFTSSYKDEGWWSDGRYPAEVSKTAPFLKQNILSKMNEEQRLEMLYEHYNKIPNSLHAEKNVFFLTYREMVTKPQLKSKEICQFLNAKEKFFLEEAHTKQLDRWKEDR